MVSVSEASLRVIYVLILNGGGVARTEKWGYLALDIPSGKATIVHGLSKEVLEKIAWGNPSHTFFTSGGVSKTDGAGCIRWYVAAATMF